MSHRHGWMMCRMTACCFEVLLALFEEIEIQTRLGTGVCIFISGRFYRNITICEQMCTRDIELFSFSWRCFYLPSGGDMQVNCAYMGVGVSNELTLNR